MPLFVLTVLGDRVSGYQGSNYMVSKAIASGERPDAQTSLRIGVVGAGIMGSNHARVLAGLPDATLVGIVDPLPVDVLQELGVRKIMAVNDISSSDRIRVCQQAQRELAGQPRRRARTDSTISAAQPACELFRAREHLGNSHEQHPRRANPDG